MGVVRRIEKYLDDFNCHKFPFSISFACKWINSFCLVAHIVVFHFILNDAIGNFGQKLKKDPENFRCWLNPTFLFKLPTARFFSGNKLLENIPRKQPLHQKILHVFLIYGWICIYWLRYYRQKVSDSWSLFFSISPSTYSCHNEIDFQFSQRFYNKIKKQFLRSS